MPVLSAIQDHPTRPYVRLETNWADVPQVEWARVIRVDSATGACETLRPYVCYDGDYLALSCGHGIWWDTEAPFDREFYYVAEGLDAPCPPNSPLLLATFATATATGWPNADTGQVWTPTSGVAADFSSAAGWGRMQTTGASQTRRMVVDIGTDSGTLRARFIPAAIASGSNIFARVGLRSNSGGSTDAYELRAALTTAGQLQIALTKIVGGVASVITASPNPPGSNLTVGTYVAGDVIGMELTVEGSFIGGKLWNETTGTEPADWQFTATDTSLASDGTLTYAKVQFETVAANANGTMFSQWDDITVPGCGGCTPVTAQTDPLSIPSDGRFWLKDPVRPCHDQPVPLCPNGAPVIPECGGDSGILFVGTGPDVYGDNSYGLRPTNRRRTIAVTRPRSDATSALKLQTMTFADRDALLELAAPGSPLLWQGPQEYGVPDRYMRVLPVTVSPELSDLRIQVRTQTLPYETVDRPVGPTQGICGARVQDICDEYPTLDSIVAAGLTYDDLLRGPNINPDARTWNDVLAEFADWNAVLDGGNRNWDEVQGGQ